MLASLFVTVIGAKITNNESRPGINDQLRDRRPRTEVEQQFLHQFNQLTWQTFQSVYLFSREALSCYLGDLIFLIKIAFESQGAIY